MSNLLEDNIAFQRKYEFDKKKLTKEQLQFRMLLQQEEFNETLAAFLEGNSEEFVDGLIDTIVIALGTLHLAGVDTEKAWNEVYRANMSKVRGVKKGRESSGGFDVVKPDDWVGPIHEDNHGDLDELFA